MVNLLIPYVPLDDHLDPMLDEFTYGDVRGRARKLKRDLQQGDYVFLHTSIRGGRYITAYYLIDKVLDTSVAATNKNIVAKYQNPHLREYLAGERRNEDDAIIFGDTVLSRRMRRPLPFARALAEKLSLEIPFRDDFSENQCIASATRSWRALTEGDVTTLLSEIEMMEKQGLGQDTVLSTNEVLQILEVDLENSIVNNPKVIGYDLTLKGRQVPTKVGRTDLLFEDSKGALVIVELKLEEIGTEALNQIRRYIKYYRSQTHKDVKGILVCKEILPVFESKFRDLADVRVFCYGWKLEIYPREYESN